MSEDIVTRLRGRVLAAKLECRLTAPLRRVAGGATDYETIARAHARWSLRQWCRDSDARR